MKLSDYDKQILAMLGTSGGYLTGDIAEKVSPKVGHNRRTHTMAVRSILVDLERRGLVGKLDDEKPVCWVKTAAGEEAISEG